MTKHFNTNHKIMKKQQSKRKRSIIWLNPPFSKNVSNNISKYFFLLIQNYFPNNHRYKIFNKNNVKISYNCMANIKSIIKMHDKEVITEKKKKQ